MYNFRGLNIEHECGNYWNGVKQKIKLLTVYYQQLLSCYQCYAINDNERVDNFHKSCTGY